MKHLICDPERVLIIRHVGNVSGKLALKDFLDLMIGYPRASVYCQILDTRKWSGTLFDDDLRSLSDRMEKLRKDNGLENEPIPKLAYLSHLHSGADAIAPQVSRIAQQDVVPVYSPTAAWQAVANGKAMPIRAKLFLGGLRFLFS